MLSQSQRPFVCTLFNIDGEHSQMEMLLSSIFDESYSREEKVLIASNGTIEYRYMKGPLGNRMSVRVLSLNKQRPTFVVRFANKPFPVCPIDHPLLDLSHLH